MPEFLNEPYNSGSWTSSYSSVSNGGNATIVSGARGGTNAALRVRMPSGGHWGTHAIADAGGTYETMSATFYGMIPASFQPGRGGKFLGGFAGNYDGAGRGGSPSDGTNSWTARMRFDGAGSGAQVSFYTYHADMSGTFGDTFAWDFVMQPDTWYGFNIGVQMNTPGQNDGVLSAAVDGSTVFRKTDLKFRNSGFENIGVNQFWQSTYYGGSWTSPGNNDVFIDQVRADTTGPSSGGPVGGGAGGGGGGGGGGGSVGPPGTRAPDPVPRDEIEVEPEELGELGEGDMPRRGADATATIADVTLPGVFRVEASSAGRKVQYLQEVRTVGPDGTTGQTSSAAPDTSQGDGSGSGDGSGGEGESAPSEEVGGDDDGSDEPPPVTLTVDAYCTPPQFRELHALRAETELFDVSLPGYEYEEMTLADLSRRDAGEQRGAYRTTIKVQEHREAEAETGAEQGADPPGDETGGDQTEGDPESETPGSEDGDDGLGTDRPP